MAAAWLFAAPAAAGAHALQHTQLPGELAAVAALPSPATLDALFEQHSRRGSGGGSGNGGGGGGGQAVPRGGSDGSTAGAGTRSGGGSGSSGGTATSGGSRRTASGGSDTGGATTRVDNGGTSTRGDGASGTPTYSRPREDRPATGTAVERRGEGGGTIIVGGGGYYPGFYPWGWGGLGVGGYYGYYDPWGWYDPYPVSGGYVYGNDDGALKIKVTPRQAEVFVDGYFAGAVDDYDGLFQRLRLEPGPHRIEIRLDQYEPLAFDIRIEPDRTITYKGEMRKVGG
jgi:hypothetical protein